MLRRGIPTFPTKYWGTTARSGDGVHGSLGMLRKKKTCFFSGPKNQLGPSKREWFVWMCLLLREPSKPLVLRSRDLHWALACGRNPLSTFLGSAWLLWKICFCSICFLGGLFGWIRCSTMQNDSVRFWATIPVGIIFQRSKTYGHSVP